MTALRSLLGAALLAGATVVTWYAWLGHDDEYYLDAAGNEAGPYTTMQIAGCVLTLVALLVAAVLLRVHPLVAAAAMTLAFTVAWTAHAAASDETGLFLVGTILVFFGMAAGTTVVGLIARALRRPRPATR